MSRFADSQFTVPDVAPNALVELDLPVEAPLKLSLLLRCSLIISNTIECTVRRMAKLRN